MKIKIEIENDDSRTTGEYDRILLDRAKTLLKEVLEEFDKRSNKSIQVEEAVEVEK